MKKSGLLFILILVLVFVSCDNNPNVCSTADNSSLAEESATSDFSSATSTTFSESSDGDAQSKTQPEESWEYITYEDVLCEFQGEWKITKYYTEATTLLHTCEYVTKHSLGATMNFSENGILLFGNCYSQHPNFKSTLQRMTIYDLCFYLGHLPIDEVPFEDKNGAMCELFDLSVCDPKLDRNDESAISNISIYIIEDNCIFVGIDMIYYIAERVI